MTDRKPWFGDASADVEPVTTKLGLADFPTAWGYQQYMRTLHLPGEEE